MSEESEEQRDVSERKRVLTLVADDQVAEEKPLIDASVDQPDDRKGQANANADEEVERQTRRLSRRGFMWSAAAAAAGFGGWRWLVTRREDDGIPWPLRRVHEINEQLARDYFHASRLAPTFPREQAGMPRVNGDIGLDDDFDPTTWRLRVMGLADMSVAAPIASAVVDNDDHQSDRTDIGDVTNALALMLTLDHIKALPRVEMVTELKCIEGWSVVVQWAGARFADFANIYQPATQSGKPPDLRNKPEDLVRYVSLATPDGGYYVGLDMESALHPQTLLCYEMNGAPLTVKHGAPLRLIIPVKYGIKNLKRIGTIRFTDQRPADYWAERGYDWYAGH
jgi:hypothetical protein